MNWWQRFRHWLNGGHRAILVRSIWPYEPQWFVRCKWCGLSTRVVNGDPYEYHEEDDWGRGERADERPRSAPPMAPADRPEPSEGAGGTEGRRSRQNAPEGQ